MMNELFAEDIDLLEAVYIQEELFKFKRKKIIEPTISHNEAKRKAMHIMKKVLSDSKYNKFKKTIKVKLDNESEDIVGFYDCYSYGKNMRSDETGEYTEWDSLFRSFEKDVNNELNKFGYFIDCSDGDWDGGPIYIDSPAIIKEAFMNNQVI